MMARGFVKNGATVYISSRNGKVCQEEANELSKDGPGKCIGLPGVDLASGRAACVELANHLVAAGVSKLNVLINNSGTSWGESLEQHQEKGFDKVMDLNVKALFYVTVACLPLLRAAATKEDPARVINIGSIAGIRFQIVPTYSYDISKAAVHHLTKKLAAELSSDFITVNAIAPGLFPSKMSDQLLTYTSKEVIEANIPLRKVGEEEDLAGAALYLSSKAGRWVTGIVLPVDGGALLSQFSTVPQSNL